MIEVGLGVGNRALSPILLVVESLPIHPYRRQAPPTVAITHGIGTNVNDIAWDLAGNIYICGNSSEWLKGFALPGHSNFVTKAPLSESIATSLSEVSADDVNAPVEYFNLQGIRVSGDNLTPGIYIRRQGKIAEKIVVK